MRRTHPLLMAAALLVSGVVSGTTITVNSTSDDPATIGRGICKLRNAIIAANSNAVSGFCAAGSGTGDVIVFDVGSGNPQIDVGAPGFLGSAGPLPEITEGVTIDGATGGATRVVLHWAGTTGSSAIGVYIAATAPGTTIRGLVINGFPSVGILDLAQNVTIAGNFIGTDAGGTAAQANAGGISMGEGASGVIGGAGGTTPGGPCTGDCNLVAGNSGDGISVKEASAVVIEGNFIGTTAEGDSLLGNVFNGISVSGSFAVTIGGHSSAARNVISGNLASGVSIASSLVNSSAYNSVIGNYIGVTADGSGSLGNAQFGVLFSNPGAVPDNRFNNVGSEFPQDANVIAFNGYDGIRVAGAQGSYVYGNSIRVNSIHDNGLLGIRDTAGGNLEIPFPNITQANTVISGNGACGSCAIDVYADAAEEGRTYLGTATASAGVWTLPVAAPGPHITATATDGSGNTSEFSPPFSCPDFDQNGICDGVDDVDHDGIVDALDDCVTTTNASQYDSNADGYGNACDADLNNDGTVNFADLALFRAAFGSANADADLNGNGNVNFADLAIFRSLFGRAPGPKGSALP